MEFKKHPNRCNFGKISDQNTSENGLMSLCACGTVTFLIIIIFCVADITSIITLDSLKKSVRVWKQNGSIDFIRRFMHKGRRQRVLLQKIMIWVDWLYNQINYGSIDHKPARYWCWFMYHCILSNFFYILQTNLQFLFSYISTVVGLMTKSNWRKKVNLMVK